ncbi:MAG: hypothetical protein JSS94_06820 [Bacteroidetes bacterium]|nr:hypothetical protein [Bacteroidota bacterium]
MKTKIVSVSLLLLLVTNCKKNDNLTKNEDDTTKTEFAENSKIDLDDRYIGGWKIVDINVGKSKNDHSMDGIICEMEKYPNSENSYVFHLFTGHKLILTKETDNYLVGQNANMNANYDDNSETLTISIPKGSSWTFKKIR